MAFCIVQPLAKRMSATVGRTTTGVIRNLANIAYEDIVGVQVCPLLGVANRYSGQVESFVGTLEISAPTHAAI
jgi:hypothetical protein